MAGKPTKIGDVDSKTPFGWAWVVNANEIEIRTARRDLKRDSADLHVAKLFSRLTIARNAEEAADEGHFVDLFDFEKFRGKPVINVKLRPFTFSEFPPEIRETIYDHVMALPADRDTVFVQPPWKWYKYANPDFRHALFKISKWIRKEAICRLLSQNNLNFDSAEDINWLYFWANNGGVKVDVEYNIYKLQFLEFDRYNQHMDYNKFLDRVVKASQLRSLKMRFAAFRLGGDSVDDIIQEYELDRLRVMRGLEHVECWLWNYGNNHSSPRMLELTRWLREEMCKPMGMVSEEAQSIAKAV